MTRLRAHRLAAVAYAVADLAVIMAPSIVLAVTAHKGGLTTLHGLDLVLASAVIGMAHAVVAYLRLVDEARVAARRLDIWIAAVDALVVLALGATLLLIAVLGGFAEAHAVLVNRGWPVVWLWVGVQVVAVALSEAAGRLVFRWLEGAVPERTTGSSVEPPPPVLMKSGR